MHTYTINGDTYIPFNSSLYRVCEEVTDINELEHKTPYLHEDTVGQFEVEDLGYSTFDAIFIPKNNPDHKRYYTIEDTGNLGDEFESARKLHRVVPDQLETCPDCGAAAGEKDDPDTPRCFYCGYGTHA